MVAMNERIAHVEQEQQQQQQQQQEEEEEQEATEGVIYELDNGNMQIVGVPMSTTVQGLIDIGLALWGGTDDDPIVFSDITITFRRPDNESSDGESVLALGVRGCWAVRVFASFSRFCGSCFCFPFVGSSLPALRGEWRC